jgi:hypothetical protein
MEADRPVGEGRGHGRRPQVIFSIYDLSNNVAYLHAWAFSDQPCQSIFTLEIVIVIIIFRRVPVLQPGTSEHTHALYARVLAHTHTLSLSLRICT